MNAPLRHGWAAAQIWALVCGFPEPMRSERLLLMLALEAYIDDSNMNTPPVSILGGWIGSAKDWAHFSDCWAEALWMKPRLNYFKLSEAQSFKGEFHGWSKQSRDERIQLLVRIIERHKFLGVVSAMPLDSYKEVFGHLPDPGVRAPYFLSFYGIISHLMAYYQGQGISEPIDFIFDYQPGSVDVVMGAWERFRQVAPPELVPLIGDPPIFRDDKRTVALQAADLAAGWSRQLAEDHYYGRSARVPPWGPDIKPDITVLGRLDQTNDARFAEHSQSDWRSFGGALREATLPNALSKSSAFSDASTSRAISLKRAWRSVSVSFGFFADFARDI
jgi:Protein of unknown function (DUF3800)